MRVDWKYVTLGDAVTKGSSNISLGKIKEEAGDYPIYGAKGLVKYVSFFQQEKDYLAIIKDGAGIGRVSRHPGKSSVLATMQYLSPKDGFDIGFVAYFLDSVDFDKYRNGSTIPHIYFKDYKNEPIPVPPIEEQRRIVAILDEAFAGIATAVANTEKNLANARELFESYLNAVFLKGAHVWTRRRLEEVCEKITVGHVGSMATRYKPEGIPLLRSQNIRPFRVDLENVVYIDEAFHSELKKSALKPGDLGIVRTGYPGTAAVIPDTLPISNCSDLVIVRPGDQVLSSFLALVFNSTFGKQTVAGVLVGAAQKHFNVTSAKAALVPIPSREEQTRVVIESGEVRQECEKLEAICQQKLNALAELKQSLLQKAFSGELTAVPQGEIETALA